MRRKITVAKLLSSAETFALITTVKRGLTMKKSYQLVPPDGGYGYVILIAVSVCLISTTMFVVCFGIIFNEFFIEMGMDSMSISLLTGINALSVAVAGFFTGPLLKAMSRRKLALIGSVFFNLGVFVTVFVNSEAQLIACQALQNFGIGFLYNVSVTMLNDYFVEKRFLSSSIAQTLPAVAAMVAPMIVSWAKIEHGFRGTLFVVSAVGLQTFVAAALMQPVAWHMRKEYFDDVPENKLLLEKNKSADFNNETKTPVVKLTDTENADLVYGEEERAKPSIGNILITWFKNFLDWPLFKKFVLTCGCLGPTTAIFVDNTYMFFLAQAFYDLKWDNDQVKWAFALIGFGDIACRVLLIFCSSWLTRLGSHPIYVMGLLIGIATKLGLLWVRDYTASLAIITVMGVSRCTIMVLYPLVVADSVQPEQFPSAMGITMMVFGLLSLVLGPAAGAIRDATGEYTTMFVPLIGILIAITVAWLIELIRARRRDGKTCAKEIK